MSDPIRILITDDHAIVREGISLVLETVEGLEVVGEAGDGEEAIAGERTSGSPPEPLQ